LLGRYRYLAPKNLPTLRRKFPNLEINFKTIHSSKGLEADHVIILGVYRGRTGFPSEIVDDPLLNLVSPDEEFFENAEERRVMYVALTRARQSVTLMSSSTKQSAFVAEMLKEPEYLVADHTGPTHHKHICGECGGNLLAFHKKNGGMWYRCEHEKLCGNTMNSCGVCGLDIPKIKQNSNLLRCSCGEEYQACPSLDCCDGWLVERNSRFGQFLGCAKYPKCSGKLQL
jgi:DNA helicase-4